MATPLTTMQMLGILRREGLDPVQFRRWGTHNRNSVGPWGPVHGVMIHHTVTGADVLATVRLCYDGHSDLPGPLCHAVGGKDGKIYLVSNGRANHAGKGDPDVLAAVEREAATLPPDNTATVDGNRYFYGLEIQNRGDGKDPYPEAQYDAAVRWATALCRAHGWSHRSVIGHSEWQPGKVDPSFNMDKFRADVQARLKVATPKPKPVPAPSTTPGGAMQFTSLALNGPVTIAPGASKISYWNAEYRDGSGDHGTGGKTIVSGEHFTGSVALAFSGQPPVGVFVRMVHELDSGGTSADYAAEVTAALFAFPYTGRVPEDRNLVFEIENTSIVPVTLDWAAVRGGTWAL